jgi:predicted Rdx family selenoprotein
MQPEESGFWHDWLATCAQRVRLLYVLQENAILRNDWSALQQLVQELEQILDTLRLTPPSEMPAEVIAFARDIWQMNQNLQAVMEEQINTLRAEIASLHRVRDTVQRYRTFHVTGNLEDCAA